VAEIASTSLRRGAWRDQRDHPPSETSVHPIRAGRSDGAVARPVEIVAMAPLSIVLLSLSMSADAFAASIGRGAATRPSMAGTFKGALVFGTIEAITPLIGWSLGLATSSFIGAVDHWVAFALLAAVGGKMIFEALRSDRTADAGAGDRGTLTLIATAIGTSLDAAAVGVSLALIGANIVVIALSIGLATFTVTAIGQMIGRAAGARLGRTVEMMGGVVLIGIGTLILLEHTGHIASSLS
jgi:putative Mn2+ efflux pump MntP